MWRFGVVSSIGEVRGLLNLVSRAKFAGSQHDELRGSGLNQPAMEEFVGSGLDRDVQPVALIVDSNHRLVQRGLIRSFVAGRL